MTQPNKQLIVWGERILDPIFIFVCASWFKDTEWVVSSHLVSIKRIWTVKYLSPILSNKQNSEQGRWGKEEEKEMLTVYTNFNSFKAHSNSYYLHSICKEMGAFERLCNFSKLALKEFEMNTGSPSIWVFIFEGKKSKYQIASKIWKHCKQPIVGTFQTKPLQTLFPNWNCTKCIQDSSTSQKLQNH